jgi:hypothetical protein
MSIELSFKGVAGFYQQNQALIQTLGDTAQAAVGEIRTLAGQLDDLRQQGAELVPLLNARSFELATDAAVRQQQQDLLAKIEATQAKIIKFIDAPDLTTPLYADLAGYYAELANTYNQTARRFVRFTNAEIAELSSLIQQATLDAIARQRWADVLDATVALTKLALKVAVKLAA